MVSRSAKKYLAICGLLAILLLLYYSGGGSRAGIGTHTHESAQSVEELALLALVLVISDSFGTGCYLSH
jgi:hypothetical protein